MVICSSALFFSVLAWTFHWKIHFSSNLEADACAVFVYCLSIVTASICLDVVGGSFFFSLKASNNDPQSGFVHFLPENIWVKKQFCNQFLFLLLHLDGCDSLTFIQASLYIQNNSDFLFSQFFSSVHPFIFPVWPNTSFNALTQRGNFAFLHFFFASSFQSCQSPPALQPWLQKVVGFLGNCWHICQPLARILDTSLDTWEYQMLMFRQLNPFSKSAQWYHFPYGDTDISISGCPSFVQMGIKLPHFRASLWACSF